VINSAVRDDSARATVLSLFSGLCKLAMVAGTSVVGVVLAHHGSADVAAVAGLSVACWLCATVLALLGVVLVVRLSKSSAMMADKAKQA
jgi:predicted MFS family arabinose efflux permease